MTDQQMEVEIAGMDENELELDLIRKGVIEGTRPSMDDTEIVLLELLRKMRGLYPQDRERAVAVLVNTITALVEGTPYAELGLKIVAAYAATFEPGEVT